MPQQLQVLVIDDNPTIVETLSDLLTPHGYRVRTAGSGREALALLNGFFRQRRYLPKVVITDFQMPEMNGIELARQITLLNPDLPVILYSGTDLSDQQALVDAAGIKLVLNKPARIEEIKAAIESVIVATPRPS